MSVDVSGSGGVVWARKGVVLTAGLVAHAVAAVVTQVPWTVDAGVGPAGAVSLTGAQVAPGVLAMALAGLAAGAFGACVAGGWGRASSRFSSPVGVDGGGGGRDAASDWDALSRGEDPTV
ncbi:hypothetical protein GZ176_05975 [Dermatophilus congolensis]|uniref:hypothetical protein n=1 Tax=Dermatophilus congolensis TaxID=1863 RepID=UPI001AB0220E|nr:hypothetical protein [Dermatophilus congolensis]MBO3212925.1 hypothetical protein [Dermatophilus congolensis]